MLVTLVALIVLNADLEFELVKLFLCLGRWDVNLQKTERTLLQVRVVRDLPQTATPTDIFHHHPHEKKQTNTHRIYIKYTMKATVAAVAVLALIYLFSTAAVSAQAGASFSTCCISGFTGWIKLPTEECKPIKCPTWSYFDRLNPREEALSESNSELLPFLMPHHITDGVKERVTDVAKGAIGMTKQAYDEWNRRMGWLDDVSDETVAAPLKKKKRASFGGGRKFINQRHRRRPQLGGAWRRRRSGAPRRFVQRRDQAPTQSLSEYVRCTGRYCRW